MKNFWNLRVMFLKRNKLYLLIFVLGLIIRIFGFGFLGFKYDTLISFYSWAEQAKRLGLVGFWLSPYQFTKDYPPLGILLYQSFNFFCNSSRCFVLNFKIFNSIIDFVLATYVVFFIPNLKSFYKKTLFVLIFLNPSLIFISAYWGQYDSLLVLLVFISARYLSSNKFFLSAVIFALGVCVKPSPLIFLPFMFFYATVNKGLKSFIVGLVLLGTSVNGIFFVYNPLLTLKVFFAQFYRTSIPTNGAANFWSIFYNWEITGAKNLYNLNFNPEFFSILFFSASLIYFLIIFTKLGFFKKITFLHILEIFVVINFLVFFFLTKMHSRYGHFTLVYSLVVSAYLDNFKYKNSIVYYIFTVFFNVVYFINQLVVYYYWYPAFNLTIFPSNFLSILGLGNVLCLFLLIFYYTNRLNYLKKA